MMIKTPFTDAVVKDIPKAASIGSTKSPVSVGGGPKGDAPTSTPLVHSYDLGEPGPLKTFTKTEMKR